MNALDRTKTRTLGSTLAVILVIGVWGGLMVRGQAPPASQPATPPPQEKFPLTMNSVEHFPLDHPLRQALKELEAVWKQPEFAKPAASDGELQRLRKERYNCAVRDLELRF